jgi:hypothetical protein
MKEILKENGFLNDFYYSINELHFKKNLLIEVLLLSRYILAKFRCLSKAQNDFVFLTILDIYLRALGTAQIKLMKD